MQMKSKTMLIVWLFLSAILMIAFFACSNHTRTTNDDDSLACAELQTNDRYNELISRDISINQLVQLLADSSRDIAAWIREDGIDLPYLQTRLVACLLSDRKEVDSVIVSSTFHSVSFRYTDTGRWDNWLATHP